MNPSNWLNATGLIVGFLIYTTLKGNLVNYMRVIGVVPDNGSTTPTGNSPAQTALDVALPSIGSISSIPGWNF